MWSSETRKPSRTTPVNERRRQLTPAKTPLSLSERDTCDSRCFLDSTLLPYQLLAYIWMHQELEARKPRNHPEVSRLELCPGRLQHSLAPPHIRNQQHTSNRNPTFSTYAFYCMSLLLTTHVTQAPVMFENMVVSLPSITVDASPKNYAISSAVQVLSKLSERANSL